jgi:hypothetical protein
MRLAVQEQNKMTKHQIETESLFDKLHSAQCNNQKDLAICYVHAIKACVRADTQSMNYWISQAQYLENFNTPKVSFLDRPNSLISSAA